jgi:hypothetical protein
MPHPRDRVEDENPHLQPEEGVKGNSFVSTFTLTKNGRSGVITYYKDDAYCIKVCNPRGDLDVVIDEQEDGTTIYRFKAKKEEDR